jgi:hypothetical protein
LGIYIGGYVEWRWLMFKIICFPVVLIGAVFLKLVRFVWTAFIIFLVAVITAFVGLMREKW